MTMLSTMDDLLLYELGDLYDAEQQLLIALPKMAAAASNSDLKQGFMDHLRQTQGQTERLEAIFDDLGEPTAGNRCKGMAGLIAEGEDIIGSSADPNVKDAALIGAAQRVEHYEMAGYGAARAHAEQLGHNRAARLLQENLDQEGETDKKLTKLAEGGWFTGGINIEATQ